MSIFTSELAYLLIIVGLGLKTMFDEKRNRLMVVRTSVFSLVRHPVYLGSMLLYLGFIILSMSLIAFAIWIIIILFYYYISRFEENLLINKLGGEYLKYMQDVPMFILLRPLSVVQYLLNRSSI